MHDVLVRLKQQKSGNGCDAISNPVLGCIAYTMRLAKLHMMRSGVMVVGCDCMPHLSFELPPMYFLCSKLALNCPLLTAECTLDVML